MPHDAMFLYVQLDIAAVTCCSLPCIGHPNDNIQQQRWRTFFMKGMLPAAAECVCSTMSASWYAASCSRTVTSFGLSTLRISCQMPDLQVYAVHTEQLVACGLSTLRILCLRPASQLLHNWH